MNLTAKSSTTRQESLGIFQAYANSMVITSYSKDLSLPGERIGYVAVNPQMENWRQMRRLDLLQPHLRLCQRSSSHAAYSAQAPGYEG